MPFPPSRIAIAGVILASALAAGCSGLGSADAQKIEDLRRQIDDAQQDPDLRRYGGASLAEAEQALAQARQATGDRAKVRHFTYLAERKLEIARSIAGLKAATTQLSALPNKPRKAKVTSPAAGGKRQLATTLASQPASSGSAAPPMLGKDRSRPWAELSLRGLFVDPDLSTLAPAAGNDLIPLVHFLRENPDPLVLLEIYTTVYESKAIEHAWSLHAAEAVKSHLVAQGVDGKRIMILGRSEPAADSPSAAPDDADPERIEVHVFGKGSKSQPVLQAPTPRSVARPPVR